MPTFCLCFCSLPPDSHLAPPAPTTQSPYGWTVPLPSSYSYPLTYIHPPFQEMLVTLAVALLLLPSPLLAAPAIPRSSLLNPKAVTIPTARWIALSSSFRMPGEPTPAPSTPPLPDAALPTRATTVPINAKNRPARRAYTDDHALTHLPRALATPVSLHEKRGAKWLLPPRRMPRDGLPPAEVTAQVVVRTEGVSAVESSSVESSPLPSSGAPSASAASDSEAPSSSAPTTKTTEEGATATDKRTDPVSS